jgi:hypothetical protein
MAKEKRKMKVSYLQSLFDFRLLSFFFVVILFFSIFFVVGIIQSKKNTNLTINAAGPGCKCNDPNKCYPDGCTRDTSKIGGDCGGNADLGPEPGISCQTLCVNTPPCCAGGGGNCCWIERAYCTLEQCGGSTKGGCAWYWIWHEGETNKPEGYCCMQGSSPETMKPKYGRPSITTPSVKPTNLPPTNPPPTNPPHPSNTPYLSPTSPLIPTASSIPPYPTATSTPPTFSPSTAPTQPPVFPTSTPYIYPTNAPYYPSPQPTYNYPTQAYPSVIPTVYINVTAVPSSTPTPKPIIKEVIKNTQNFMQKVKVALIDFLTKVLP